MTLQKCGPRVLERHQNQNYQVSHQSTGNETGKKTGSDQLELKFDILRYFLSNIDENSIRWSIGSEIQDGGTIPWNVCSESSWKVSFNISIVTNLLLSPFYFCHHFMTFVTIKTQNLSLSSLL